MKTTVAIFEGAKFSLFTVAIFNKGARVSSKRRRKSPRYILNRIYNNPVKDKANLNIFKPRKKTIRLSVKPRSHRYKMSIITTLIKLSSVADHN